MGSCSPKTCDASQAPANGAVGDCSANLASGISYQPTCGEEYSASGASSCLLGTLTAATCSDILCTTNQHVKDNQCVTCPAGTSNTDGGDGAFGGDTTRDGIICGVNEYVAGNACAWNHQRRRRRHRFGRRHDLRQNAMRG
jgi:hypothetical protein